MKSSIRVADTSDLPALKTVLEQVYRGGGTLSDDALAYEEGEWAAIAHLDDQAAGAFQVFPLNLSRGRGRIKTAGIAAVGVMPQFRRCGLGRELMEWSLHEIHHQGYGLASLYAFKESYYRKFGYTCAGRRFQISCAVDALPHFRAQLPVRQLKREDIRQVEGVYGEFINRVSAGNERLDWQWDNRLGDNPPTLIVAGDPIEAYFWCHLSGKFWQDIELGELVYSSLRGYESVMAAAAGIAENANKLVWTEPSSGPFVSQFLQRNHTTEVALHREAMFRLVDVRVALSSLKPEGKGSFSLKVVDPILAENAGPWRVEFADGVCAVEPAGSADFTLGQGALAQAILGEPSLALLGEWGLVDVHNASGFQAACEALPPSPAMLTEFF